MKHNYLWEVAAVGALMLAISLFIWLTNFNSDLKKVASACHRSGGVMVQSGEPGGSGGAVCVQPVLVKEAT